MQSRATEEMVLPLPDSGRGTLSAEAYGPIMEFLGSNADILAIGPGISVNDEIRSLVKKIITAGTCPMILDADAINVLEGDTAVLKKARAPIILTPHAGEMARLLGSSHGRTGAAEVNTDRINCARAFSKRTGAYLVLKGAPTLISDCDGRIYINTTGNPGMATAGSGDVLTGMIAGLMGQSMHPLDACRTGVFLHGLAGDMAAGSVGMHSLIASDIISMVHKAFLSFS
jgi:NAD(P)H-hydrate epimerase